MGGIEMTVVIKNICKQLPLNQDHFSGEELLRIALHLTDVGELRRRYNRWALEPWRLIIRINGETIREFRSANMKILFPLSIENAYENSCGGTFHGRKEDCAKMIDIVRVSANSIIEGDFYEI